MKLNESFIPDEEIRQDYIKIESSPSIDVKREIGTKYGLQRNECTRWQNIAIAILEYLRTVRNHKDQFTHWDVHDFFKLTNYNGQYEKLKPYLNLESGKFIKYILDFEYSHLLNTGIKPYILDNIDTVKLTSDIYGSLQRKFWLERYKSIKKFYDEQYGLKAGKAESDNRKTYELQSMIIEETYDYRIQLEQYLENFILECYDIYKYGSSEYIKLCKLMEHYCDLIREKKPHYEPHHRADSDELKWIKYRDNLHFLIAIYYYFYEDAHFSSHPLREKRIEMSIDYFNQRFDKLIDKNIIKPLIAKDVDIDSIKISDLEQVEFGFYFTISYSDNKKMYVNFILQHDFQDTSNMDEFIKHSHLYNTNIINKSIMCYQMKVSVKPLKESSLNEGFDYNKIRLALDDYEDNNQLSSKSNIIKNAGGKELWNLYNGFVDLGLPSGTMWAKYNLGCDWNKLNNQHEHTKPEDWYGNYYAWGELTPKTEYQEYNYRLTKYNKEDGLTELQLEDDAAYQTDNRMKIPTKEQFEELLKYTTNKCIKNYQGIKGLNGSLLTSKINGEQLFMPAAGNKYEDQLHGVGDDYYLWSSSLDKGYPVSAWILYFYSTGYINLNCFYRDSGFAVRPVLNR